MPDTRPDMWLEPVKRQLHSIGKLIFSFIGVGDTPVDVSIRDIQSPTKRLRTLPPTLQSKGFPTFHLSKGANYLLEFGVSDPSIENIMIGILSFESNGR